MWAPYVAIQPAIIGRPSNANMRSTVRAKRSLIQQPSERVDLKLERRILTNHARVAWASTQIHEHAGTDPIVRDVVACCSEFGLDTGYCEKSHTDANGFQPSCELYVKPP